jgi:hypothetical protein
MKRFLFLVPIAIGACASPPPEPIMDASIYAPGKAGILVAPAVLGVQIQRCPDGTVIEMPGNCSDGASFGTSVRLAQPSGTGPTPPSGTGPTPPSGTGPTPPSGSGSNGNNGWGNGSQDAPGNSGAGNRAENGPQGKNDNIGKNSGNSGKGKAGSRGNDDQNARGNSAGKNSSENNEGVKSSPSERGAFLPLIVGQRTLNS